LSNGIESKIGSLTSRFEHFHDWKRISSEEEEGIVSLDTILKGVCHQERFLDLFENFIFFDTSIGSTVKLIARNHQFIGVNKAIAHLKHQRSQQRAGAITAEAAQKLGVFWHTQGSGKSYSMAFFCQKVLRTIGEGYTFLVVTDRTELDQQIYATFAGVGVNTDQTARANSGEDLKQLLSSDKRFVFTLIHKFNFDQTITQRNNIIVISDEAHRTQSGTFALNMRKALPNASFMGFTGTPLFRDDELTRRIFGDYVSKYDFKRSIEDGATVPLYYENRGEKLKLTNPKINEQIRETIDSYDLDTHQEAKLNMLLKKEYPIFTSETRLRSIARDVVRHFNQRGYKGKGMFVALDKPTAVKMYDFISEEWDIYLKEKAEQIAQITDSQEQLIERRALEWAKETEIAVVISQSQNEIDKFKALGLDIEPHRLKMNTRDLERDFKDETHPFRLAIVCGMWITGFDVPSMSTLYLDKPMKTHTLMQTIARANRVHEGKNNGWIVDYIETYRALLEALAIYGDTTTRSKNAPQTAEDAPIQPPEELVEALDQTIANLELFLQNECKFQLGKITKAKDKLHRIKYIAEGYEAISRTGETKSRFNALAREVFKKYKSLLPQKAVGKFREKYEAINALYAMASDKIKDADVSEVITAVQKIIDKSVKELNSAIEKVEQHGTKIDISRVNFEKIKEEFLKLESTQNVALANFANKVGDKIERLLDQNPERANYYERYQEIIDEYNHGKNDDNVKEIFERLNDLFADLTIEARRAAQEGLSETQLTIYDILLKGKKLNEADKKKVKDVARAVLTRLHNHELKAHLWWVKTSTSAMVRKAIKDILYEYLPMSYNDGDLDEKTTDIYRYFFNNRTTSDEDRGE
jgi:type I restriction enzyme R subunit